MGHPGRAMHNMTLTRLTSASNDGKNCSFNNASYVVDHDWFIFYTLKVSGSIIRRRAL